MEAEITIQVNGQAHPVSAGSSLSGLLLALGLGDTTVLVELNGKALFPREFPTTRLGAGDRLEVIRIAAGG